MPPNPTRRQLHEAIRAERRALALLVETLTPEQWSQGSGSVEWTVGELVGHLLVGDSGTWRVGFTLARIRSTWAWIEKRQRQIAERGPDFAAAQLRSNGLSITARLPGRLGPRGNLAEMIIHVEDIRRPLGIPRPEPPMHAPALAALATVARWQFRKLKTAGTLAITTSDGPAFTVRSGFPLPRVREGSDGADARIEGSTVELMLFLTGRPASVAVEGDSALATRLRQPMPRL
ncbi:MAG: maleylpyruvate isomerase family mycothiol-dependent enzyme [Chloroflexi bacterium]|nr:maleylpyruvate isomerase family mycothiol-dependent enzyme [Chloroflexota bacterium]